MFLGWLAAFITGLGLPSFVFLIGDVINSFDPYKTDANELLNKIKLISLIYTIIGIGIFIFSYVFYSFLLISSELMVQTIRKKYLESILK